MHLPVSFQILPSLLCCTAEMIRRPDMLLVGMGNPLQEKWIQRHLPQLDVALCLGTSLQITPYANSRPNFSSPQVCRFVQDSFTLWLSECHVDGFRWDTPDLMMHDNDYNYIPAAGNLMTGIETR